MPSTNIWIMCVIMIILSSISWFILDEYGIRYRVMSKILKKRWLYSAVTYSLLSSNLLLLLAAWFFPNWWLYILGGIWIGTVGQFPPLYHGIRSSLAPWHSLESCLRKLPLIGGSLSIIQLAPQCNICYLNAHDTW